MPDIEIKVNEAYIEKLRKLFRLEEKDLALIRQVGDRVIPTVEQLVDGVYKHILSFPELAAVFHDEQTRQRFREGEKRQLAKLLSGVIDEEHIQSALRVGATHETAGVEPIWYLACYTFYAENILQRTLDETQDIPKNQLTRMYQALAKIIFLDISLAWEAYYRQKEQRIKDAYKILEMDHNLALAMIEQRDIEIKELLKARGKHPG